MSMRHTQKKRFTDKELYQKSSYGSDVPSWTYPLTFPHPETSIVYLPTPLSLGCHLWMTPKKNCHRLKYFYLYSVLVNMYTPMFNKQFRKQNLATSKFLVKCLLFTTSFLNSRTQYEHGTHTEKTIHWQEDLSKINIW